MVSSRSIRHRPICFMCWAGAGVSLGRPRQDENKLQANQGSTVSQSHQERSRVIPRETPYDVSSRSFCKPMYEPLLRPEQRLVQPKARSRQSLSLQSSLDLDSGSKLSGRISNVARRVGDQRARFRSESGRIQSLGAQSRIGAIPDCRL